MTQFRLDENHPAALEPGKRPRISPNPGMILKDGELFLTYGTPGGDMQTQAMAQMVLNMLIWDMDIQEAIDTPRFRSYNFSDSFSPTSIAPVRSRWRGLCMKHTLQIWNRTAMLWKNEQHGIIILGPSLCGIMWNPQSGEMIGGADPREESWAVGK